MLRRSVRERRRSTSPRPSSSWISGVTEDLSRAMARPSAAWVMPGLVADDGHCGEPAGLQVAHAGMAGEGAERGVLGHAQVEADIVAEHPEANAVGGSCPGRRPTPQVRICGCGRGFAPPVEPATREPPRCRLPFASPAASARGRRHEYRLDPNYIAGSPESQTKDFGRFALYQSAPCGGRAINSSRALRRSSRSAPSPP